MAASCLACSCCEDRICCSKGGTQAGSFVYFFSNPSAFLIYEHRMIAPEPRGGEHMSRKASGTLTGSETTRQMRNQKRRTR